LDAAKEGVDKEEVARLSEFKTERAKKAFVALNAPK
jgi:DNA-binding NtrC family response regulator